MPYFDKIPPEINRQLKEIHEAYHDQVTDPQFSVKQAKRINLKNMAGHAASEQESDDWNLLDYFLWHGRPQETKKNMMLDANICFVVKGDVTVLEYDMHGEQRHVYSACVGEVINLDLLANEDRARLRFIRADTAGKLLVMSPTKFKEKVLPKMTDSVVIEMLGELDKYGTQSTDKSRYSKRHSILAVYNFVTQYLLRSDQVITTPEGLGVQRLSNIRIGEACNLSREMTGRVFNILEQYGYVYRNGMKLVIPTTLEK